MSHDPHDHDGFDDGYDEDDYDEVALSEHFRAFMGADERLFTGQCGTLVDDLMRDCIPVFVDLMDEVFERGWTDAAGERASTLGYRLMHINEHVASGWTPVPYFEDEPFHSIAVTPAPGKWLVPALRQWMAAASTEGSSGLLRSRLPWLLPLSLRMFGDTGHMAQMNLNLGVARIGDITSRLIEMGALSQEDALALGASITSAEDADVLVGELMEMLFDVSDEQDAALVAASEDSGVPAGSLLFTVDADGEPSLVQSPVQSEVLLNDQDFSYDWGSAITAMWLMLVSVQVLHRERATLAASTGQANVDASESGAAEPLVVEIDEGAVWLWPDLGEDLSLLMSPLSVMQRDENDGDGDGWLEAAPAADSSASEQADVEDITAIREGRVMLAVLTGVAEHRSGQAFPVAELHASDDPEGQPMLRGITIPRVSESGNALRVVFHAADGDPKPHLWEIKTGSANDVIAVTGSAPLLGDVNPASGLANAIQQEALHDALRYLSDAHIDQRTVSAMSPLWAQSVLSLTRSVAAGAMQAVGFVAAERAITARQVEFATDIVDTLTEVRLLDGDGNVLAVMAGADLGRRDAIYCDLGAVYAGLSLAREMTGHAAQVLLGTDEAAEEFTAEWLPEITRTVRGLQASLNGDPYWGARVGLARVNP